VKSALKRSAKYTSTAHSILLPTVIMYHAVQIHVVVDNCSLLRDQQRFLLLSKPVPCRWCPQQF